MAAVMGDDEVSPRQFYPTPRPSIEDNSRLVATCTSTASRVVTVQSHTHDTRVDPSPRSAFTGYHTPAPSSEINQAVPHPGVARVLAEIERLDFAVTGERSAQIHGVDAATWKILEDNHAERLDVRLEYWGAEKIVVVTFASGVHESFNKLLEPLTKVAERASLIFHTNRDVPLPDLSVLIPDFALGKNIEHGEPEFFIIFECAWAQDDADVTAKVTKHFQNDSVFAVICMDIKPYKKYKAPSRRPGAEHVLERTFPAAVFTGRSLLGAVIHFQHNWGQIDTISITIHSRDGSPRSFHGLAPVEGKLDDPDLLARQDEVDEILTPMLIKAMLIQLIPRDVVKTAVEDFRLTWDAFYHTLDCNLIADAYRRCAHWVGKAPTKEEEGKAERGGLKRGLSDSKIEDDMRGIMKELTSRPRRVKKAKIE
ncbi:hypothetical protein MSAN_02484400 [Mycena sanguinolenta]|uniref:Uncharacterized protein n=1 Tax=Mycena sanguinolenta TaxID=230812 RepID=A0A8H6U450_9AGAR|nr:hypothetical protein MSAN_02484400 [Mycena sanguinolenta]